MSAPLQAGPRPWLVLSSSSGATFEALWHTLKPDSQKAFQGFFSDRKCPALDRVGGFLPKDRIHFFERPDFEKGFLAWRAQNPGAAEPIILLCGFFGILSDEFLRGCSAPVVNTHPSLLPAFPGLDRKVNLQAHETVAVSGFTVHLVNESLDGGPILFQHPVALDPAATADENRERVRAGEQRYLPLFFEKILRSSLVASDRSRSSIEVRRERSLDVKTFEEGPT